MVGQGGIILIRILKLRANSHDLMQLLKCNINFDLRKTDSWSKLKDLVRSRVRFRELLVILGVCFGKLEDSAEAFL